jgi:hypothetical protein
MQGVGIDVVRSVTNVTTSLKGLKYKIDDISWARAFFDSAVQRVANSVVNSMLWVHEEETRHHGLIFYRTPACTEAWMTSTSAVRTITAFSGFRVTHYNWNVESHGRWWKSSKGGDSDTWMDITKDNNGKVSARSTGSWMVYSSGGYVKVDSLSLLGLGGPDEEVFTIRQVQTAPLPLQDCHG